MGCDAYLMMKLQRYESAIHEELRVEQVSHPLDQYQPGSPHLELLYEQMAQAKRFQQPDTFTLNM